MPDITITRLTERQADLYRFIIADTHAEAYRRHPGVHLRNRAEFFESFDTLLSRPGFDMVLARGWLPAGCAYGYSVGRVFVVAELMVLPGQRRNHLATRLLGRLLEPHAGSGAAVMLQRANVPARTAFHHWGWHLADEVRARERTPVTELWSRAPAA